MRILILHFLYTFVILPFHQTKKQQQGGYVDMWLNQKQTYLEVILSLLRSLETGRGGGEDGVWEKPEFAIIGLRQEEDIKL